MASSPWQEKTNETTSIKSRLASFGLSQELLEPPDLVMEQRILIDLIHIVILSYQNSRARFRF